MHCEKGRGYKNAVLNKMKMATRILFSRNSLVVVDRRRRLQRTGKRARGASWANFYLVKEGEIGRILARVVYMRNAYKV